MKYDPFTNHPKFSFDQAKQKLKPGDILLCSGTSLVSKTIRDATDSVFSHVALILPLQETDQWLVLESVESYGVRCVPLLQGYVQNYMDSGHGYSGRMFLARHQHMPNQPSQMAPMYQKAFSLCGYRYADEDILKIGARIALNEFNIHEEGHVHEQKALICSEYVYTCFKAINITLPYNSKGFIAPATIAHCNEVQPIGELKTA